MVDIFIISIVTNSQGRDVTCLVVEMLRRCFVSTLCNLSFCVMDFGLSGQPESCFFVVVVVLLVV